MKEIAEKYDDLLNAIELERQAIILRLEDVHKKYGGKLSEAYYAENYAVWREHILKEKKYVEALLKEAKEKGDLLSPIFHRYMKFKNIRLGIDNQTDKS
jgi:hypothetical protein